MQLFNGEVLKVCWELQEIKDSLQELKQHLYNIEKLDITEHKEKVVIIKDSFNNNSGTINFKV